MKPESFATLDFLIHAGSLASVAAALELKNAGMSVALATHRNDLGEDLCEPLRLALPENLDFGDPLVRRLFADAKGKDTFRPMHLKHTLDQVLAEADIPVMFATYVTNLRPTPGEHQGKGRWQVELGTRSGPRVLTCGRILDGSARGNLARLLGIPLSPPSPEFAVSRRVIGGEPDSRTSVEWVCEGDVEFLQDKDIQRAPLWVGHTTGTLTDGSWAAWMDLEKDARLHLFRPGQEFSAESVFADTGERLQPGVAPEPSDGDFTAVPNEAVSDTGCNVWFAGLVANLDAPTRARTLRPDGAVAWGRELARRMLEESPGNSDIPSPPEAVMEMDVAVVGGGTGGAPAVIAAARSGARTLVAEGLSGLGGVGTLGLIGKYWFGNRVGFTAEVDEGAKTRTTKSHKDGEWDIEAKMQWYHENAARAGASIWYQTGLLESLTQNHQVVGVRLMTPQGVVTVRTGCVVDATGSAAVAASAGAETVPIGNGGLALQGSGLPGRNPGQNYGNTDYDFIDESDDEDAASAHVAARKRFQAAFDSGQLIDSRERRRIVGDLEVTPMDIRLGRVFPDAVVKARSNFDTHGFTLHPLFLIVPPDHDPMEAYVPLRALLPRGLEGVLVTGLGISAHRDAMPVIRMQADVQNQGYAAGVIAAMAAQQTVGRVRDLPFPEIQSRLIDLGILGPELRDAPDSFPLSEAEITRALAASVEDPGQIDRVFTLPDSERDQRLREAYADAESLEAKRHFAFVLGMLGDPSGAETLVEEVAGREWDVGWNYRGMGQFGASMSPLDARIIALGRTKTAGIALPALAAKAETLPKSAEFSHYRALAEAFVEIGDPGAGMVLERLLQRPGITGHAITSKAERLARVGESSTETEVRNAALIELHLAGALCTLVPGHPLGNEVLACYRKDLRALFRNYARRFPVD